MVHDLMHQPARSARQEWFGSDGVRRLQDVVRCSTRSPATFRAQSRSIGVAGMRLLDWESSELFGGGRWANRAEGLDIVLVLAGRAVFSDASGSWSAGPRELYVVRHEEPHRWAFPTGVHLRALHIPADLLPQRLRPVERTGPGRLPTSRLSSAFAAALRQGVGAALDGDAVPDYLGQGLRSLGLAVLEERLAAQDDDGPATRDRVLDFIDRNLRDVRLSPHFIAAAFDMSVRSVHYLCNVGDSTVTHEIRNRRIDAVAAHLRLEPGAATLSELAVSYGFSGREQMTRTFRRRYGMTVAEYQEALHRGTVPRPVDDAPGGGAADEARPAGQPEDRARIARQHPDPRGRFSGAA